jgi:SlyX protein
MEEPRLDDIEAKLAHHELAVSKLNEVIYRQQQQLDQLETRYQQLLQRLRQLEQGIDSEPSDEAPPPHY